ISACSARTISAFWSSSKAAFKVPIFCLLSLKIFNTKLSSFGLVLIELTLFLQLQNFSMVPTKHELTETLGLHLEGEHKLPPLAARIYAILILTAQEGLSYEDCQEKLGASKSSTSTSLNLLLNMGIISYFTKHGDRKRYFTATKKKNFFLTKLQENLKRLETEQNIISLLVDFKSCNNPNIAQNDMDKVNVYLDYVNKNKSLLKDSIKKLKTIEA